MGNWMALLKNAVYEALLVNLVPSSLRIVGCTGLWLHGGAHHIDLRPSTPEDPAWLTEQRETEIKLIEGWINYYQEKKATSSM
ncbi:hypothetical protein Patl1_28453 [Pistacia atlantica]|uniref:Uncharacterized protein n=1 Tax=Pistacia atlantica TaxID=434234 RepID=A0ACC1BBR5_9ROSI|nr:hypothetical protein Patl1_28453 [Pistacia atlantica]